MGSFLNFIESINQGAHSLFVRAHIDIYEVKNRYVTNFLGLPVVWQLAYTSNKPVLYQLYFLFLIFY